MIWLIEYIKAAEKDLAHLDNSQQVQVIKAIRKVASNPLPSTQGGYGKPLGNRASQNLTGLMKIKLLKLGIRVVYQLFIEQNIMRIIVISVRDDATAYKLVQKRIKR